MFSSALYAHVPPEYCVCAACTDSCVHVDAGLCVCVWWKCRQWGTPMVNLRVGLAVSQGCHKPAAYGSSPQPPLRFKMLCPIWALWWTKLVTTYRVAQMLFHSLNLLSSQLAAALFLQYSGSAQSHDYAEEEWVREAERREGMRGKAGYLHCQQHPHTPSIFFAHLSHLSTPLSHLPSFSQCWSQCLGVTVNQWLIQYIELYHTWFLQLYNSVIISKLCTSMSYCTNDFDSLQPKLMAKDLLDLVASHFNLKEKEYFGIAYTDET